MEAQGTTARRAARRGERGFTLVEALLATALVAIALLSQVSSSVGAFRHSRYELSRSDILQVARQFTERLRGDDDPTMLYQRLRDLMDAAALPGGGSPGAPALEDGRGTYLPQSYYADFVSPASLRALGILVDVPASAPADDPTGTRILREDVTLPGFGLPADLDGDGVLDSEARDDDHVGLPVVVRFRWQATGEAVEQLAVRTWVRIQR